LDQIQGQCQPHPSCRQPRRLPEEGFSRGVRQTPDRTPGSCKGPGVLLKDPGVLLKDPGVFLTDPGVPLKDPGVLLKDPGVFLKDPGVPLKGPRGPLKRTPGITGGLGQCQPHQSCRQPRRLPEGGFSRGGRQTPDRTTGSCKGPGVLLKDPGVLLKDPRVL